MVLTQDQISRIIAVLTPKLALSCPGCGSRSWMVGRSVVFLQSMPSTRPSLPWMLAPTQGVELGGGFPTVALICENCGNTQLYNAYVAGLAEVLGLPPSTPFVQR